LRALTRVLRIASVGNDGARVRRRVALAIGLIALAAHPAAVPEASGARGSGCPGARTSPAHSGQFMRAVLCLQDAERRKRGMGPLRTHRALRRAAGSHARDMVRRSYFGHVSPRGSTPLGRAITSGYRNSRRINVRENILTWSAPLSPAEVVRKWMASAPHRSVILRRGWRHVGIALVRKCTSGARGVTVVAEFGRK
jgi:uncharacterized protein YkwD